MSGPSVVHVYRVETDSGVGPYVSGLVALVLPGSLWAGNSRHPTEATLLPRWRQQYDAFFGFRSKAQLRSWFNTEERARAEEAGLLVRRYTVPREHVNFGEKQVVFLRSHAVDVLTIKPTEI